MAQKHILRKYQRGPVQPSVARCSPAWPGEAPCSLVQPGVARCGPVRPGAAQCPSEPQKEFCKVKLTRC